MSAYSKAYQAILENAKNGNAGNTKELFEYLDKVVFSQPNSQEIKAFGVANLACPPTATCLGTIDAIVRCNKGISSDIKVRSTGKCTVKIGITNRTLIASKNPTRVFTDQSGTAGFTKACVTLTPEFQSVVFDTDAMTDECNDCGDFAAGLARISSEAIFLGTEQDLMTTITAAVGAPIIATGDLLDKLRELYKAVANVPTNRNKKVKLYANQSVIANIKWLRDDNKLPMFDYKGACPITGCETLCFYGIEITGVDDIIIPVVSGLTNVYAVCIDNVMRTASPVEQKAKTWDQCCLENMNNRIVTMNWVTSKIDATMFPNTAKVMSIAI